MSAGQDALRKVAAWIDFSARGRIRATGEDRQRFLHAMTTNHVSGLAPGQGCYLFFLNAQGRILSDAVLLCENESFLLCTEAETRAKIVAHLNKFIIADDVTLEDVSGATAEIAIEGPEAASMLQRAGAHIPDADHAFVPWHDGILVRWSATGQPGFRWIGPPGRRQELAAALGLIGASTEDARLMRIANGVPRYGEDITESNLPQETGLAHALHFNKGCYIGQEIVERIRARGHVNKRLTRFETEVSVPPPPGAKIQADGKDVGEVTSAVTVQDGLVRGLAYLRVEALEGTSQLTAGGAVLQILK